MKSEHLYYLVKLLIVIGMVLFLIGVLRSNDLVEVPDTIYMKIVSVSDSIVVPDTFEIYDNKMRPIFNYVYVGTLLVAIEKIGYCEKITSRRYMAYCPDKSIFYVDTLFYNSVKDSLDNMVR